MITPLPGLTEAKPGSATRPFPGIKPAIYDEDGNPVEGEASGYLVIEKPWPGMLRTIYKDQQRYEDTYWNVYDGVYFVGTAPSATRMVFYWITGRVDDVMNVSGAPDLHGRGRGCPGRARRRLPRPR